MVYNKRKKISRQRGSHTHGWGSKKKHRGSGNRGGKGNAGSGKRADSKKPTLWKLGIKQGKFGFHSITKKDIRPISIKNIELSIQKMLHEKVALEADGFVVLDLGSLGYNKLLAHGQPTRKYKITVKSFVEKAKEKVESAGGQVLDGSQPTE